MVFKPFTHLARQSVAKTLVNGYAQSVVAATQSSHAASILPIHKFATPVKAHQNFGGAHNGSGAGKAPGHGGPGGDGFSTLIVAHAQNTEDKNEDKKYLFSKKILWSKAQHQQQQKKLLAGPQPVPIAENGTTKSRAGSFVEELDEAGLEAREALKSEAQKEAESEALASAVEESAEESITAEEKTSAADVLDSIVSAPSQRPKTPEITHHYNEQLKTLFSQGRYHEVEAVFRQMVVEQVPLNADSYNVLLTSIIRLGPFEISQVLDVYKSMLATKVVPDTTTYAILVDFLAVRALHSHAAVGRIEKEAARFQVMLPSKGTSAAQLRDENALGLALEIFYASTSVRTDRAFPTFVYETLVQACSKYGREDDMLNVITNMETINAPLDPTIIRSLIRGFGRNGNVRCAVETYNSWIATDAAQDAEAMDERYRVYRDLIKAYMDAGDQDGALSFLEKVIDVAKDRARIEWLSQAIVQGFLNEGDHAAAKQWITKLSIQLTSSRWLAKIVEQVADKEDLLFARVLYNSVDTATVTEDQLFDLKSSIAQCQMSALALCLRNQDTDLARALWRDLTDLSLSSGPTITATLSFVLDLYAKGSVNEATVVLNQFSEFYLQHYVPDEAESINGQFNRQARLQELYDLVIVNLGLKNLLNPTIALDITMFAQGRTGGLSPTSARYVMAQFDQGRIIGLTEPQLTSMLEVQVGLMVQEKLHNQPLGTADVALFSTMVHHATANLRIPPYAPVMKIIVDGVGICQHYNPDIAQQFENYMRSWHSAPPTPTRSMSPTSFSPSTTEHVQLPQVNMYDTVDPYANKIDHHTSTLIDKTLEKSAHPKITDIRRMYRESRRRGHSVRLDTLTRIVNAVAKTNNGYEDFLDEMLNNARKDMPMKPYVDQYPRALASWAGLLDATIAAQLNLNRRHKAEQLHQEMLEQLNTPPSANTFGLYIVSLRGSKSHDEATAAKEIFARALTEGVVPTSFLFNVLIGKLAKARRVDDSLYFFAQMRALEVTPTSVTYGTMINALTRVGDEGFAEELFREMESVASYKPRPAPYNSMMQFFVTTKRDRAKVLRYYSQMLQKKIEPTSHTYKLLIEAHATLDPPDMAAAEKLLAEIPHVESSHHAAIIHAKGCVLRDVPAAIAHFESVLAAGQVLPDSTLYQALLESLVANHRTSETEKWVADMKTRGISLTPYIANTLIHGWSKDGAMDKAQEVYQELKSGADRREPSTFEAMVRGWIAAGEMMNARQVVREMKGRGYPDAVVGRVEELVRGI